MAHYEMNLDLNVLNHLGINLYTKIPAVLSEAVANAYDADADSVYIKINIIFEKIPDKIIISEDKKYFSEEEYNELISFYKQDGDVLIKKDDLNDEQEDALSNLLFSKNSIIILDNGSGMNDKIIKTIWMNIGTSDKEVNAYSKKGRLKTGAKGIGRFALEKLSYAKSISSF